MNQEEIYQSQLAEERAQTKKIKIPSQNKSKREININTAEWVIVFLAAVIVDIIDLLDLTGFGAIIARLIDIPILLAIWIWIILKLQQLPRPQKDLIYMLFVAFIGELSPIGMFGFWTCYIVYLWLRRKKIGRIAIARGAKKIRKIKK